MCLKDFVFLGNASRAGAGRNCWRGNVTSAQQRGDDGNVVRAGSWGGKTQDTRLRGSSKQQNFCSGVQLATFPRLFAMRKSPTVKCTVMQRKEDAKEKEQCRAHLTSPHAELSCVVLTQVQGSVPQPVPLVWVSAVVQKQLHWKQ